MTRGSLVLIAGVVLFVLNVPRPAQSSGDRFSPYLEPGERLESPGDANIDVLRTVLEFYRPPRGQSRWLDRETLAATPEGGSSVSAGEVAETLIRQLGPGAFCASEARDRCRSRAGGRLRTSAVYRLDERHARVVVEFESSRPHAPSHNSTQVFVLEHDGTRWRITDRGMAARSGS